MLAAKEGNYALADRLTQIAGRLNMQRQIAETQFKIAKQLAGLDTNSVIVNILGDAESLAAIRRASSLGFAAQSRKPRPAALSPEEVAAIRRLLARLDDDGAGAAVTA